MRDKKGLSVVKDRRKVVLSRFLDVNVKEPYLMHIYGVCRENPAAGQPSSKRFYIYVPPHIWLTYRRLLSKTTTKIETKFSLKIELYHDGPFGFVTTPPPFLFSLSSKCLTRYQMMFLVLFCHGNIYQGPQHTKIHFVDNFPKRPLAKWAIKVRTDKVILSYKVSWTTLVSKHLFS